MKVIIVVPTYNEGEGIHSLLKELLYHTKHYDSEIIIVDDQSKDNTKNKVIQVMNNLPEGRIILLERNSRGVDSAITDGIKIAQGEITLLMDSDLSHPPRMIHQMISATETNDFVIGSRFVKGGKINRTFPYGTGSKILNKRIKTILGMPYNDYTGVFHAVRTERLRELLPLKYTAIWGEFDIEIIVRAAMQGQKIVELPYTYEDRTLGKSKSENLLKYWIAYTKMAKRMRREINNYGR